MQVTPPAHVQIITEVTNATFAMNHGQSILHSASGPAREWVQAGGG
jgi:hypothetical protein